MTDEQFDPDSLADYLDEVLNSNNPPTSAEDPLVDAALKLSNAPKPSLSPDAFNRIRGQVLDAAAASPPASAGLFANSSLLVGAGVLVAVVFIGVAAVFFTNGDDNESLDAVESITPPVEITAEITEEATAEIIVPEATDEPTETPEPTDEPTDEPTETPEPTETDEPTETPEPTETDEPTDTPEPTNTPMPINLVIEGPIHAIEDNAIIIFDFIIELDPDNPLLEVIEIGDYVRINGDIVADDGIPEITIDPIAVEPIGDDILVEPNTGEVWRDDGTCNNPPPAWATAYGWRARCAGGDAPGNSGDAPGQNPNNPPPGQNDDDDDDAPGNSGNAPGQNPNNPPPGQGGNPPNQDISDDCPGNSCNAPGQNPNNPPPGQGGDDDDD